MISDLREALKGAGQDDANARLVRAVLSALPEDGQLAGRGGVAGLLSQPLSERQIRLDGDGLSAASDIAMALDRGDQLAAVAVGPRVSLSLYDAHLEWAVGVGELEREQARDAAIRLHAIGLIAQRLFDGSSAERAGEMLSYEAGRALVVWFIAVELVLACHTEDEPVSVQGLKDLLDQHGESAIQDLAHLSSRADREGGQEVVRMMLGVISQAVGAAAGAVAAVAGAVRRSLPELLDGGHDELVAEHQQLPIYTMLVARLVAEIEAESLEQALPEPPPVPKDGPEKARVSQALQDAQARMAPEALATAREVSSRIDAAMGELRLRREAQKKSRKSLSRKLNRTIDRRARMAEAPPAGQAEAEAAVARCENALKATEKSVVQAHRHLGTCEEGVVAAKAAHKRRLSTLRERQSEAQIAQGAVDALEAQIASLRAEDESLLAQVKAATVAEQAAQKKAVEEMGQRLDEAKARIGAIKDELPRAREIMAGLGESRKENTEKFSQISLSREALADALVKARESHPGAQSAAKKRSDMLAHTQLRWEAADKELKAVAKVYQKAESSFARASKVVERNRQRLSEAQAAVTEASAAAAAAASAVTALQSSQDQHSQALQANQEAQVALENAQLAARRDAHGALQRALGLAVEKRDEVQQRLAAMQEALKHIEGRAESIAGRGKEHGMRRDDLESQIQQARAQREAREVLIAKQLEHVSSLDVALAELEANMATCVRTSRKAGAVHAGAAARVVGARDVHLSAVASLQSTRAEREEIIKRVADLEGSIATATKAVESHAKREATAAALSEAKPSADPPQRKSSPKRKPPPQIDSLLAELRPTLDTPKAPAVPPPPTLPPKVPPVEQAGTSDESDDDAATAMFTPQALKERLLKEQAVEDAADATVMFTRKKLGQLSPASEPDEDGDEATVMFTTEQLKARAKAELSDEEEEADDATVIFQRPTLQDEDS